MNMIAPMNHDADADAIVPLTDICSQDLFGDRRTLTIEHQGMVYTLRSTRQGKLLRPK